MSETSFPHITPVAFLQAFVTQGLLVKEKSDFSPCAGLSAYIEQLGLEASACFEAAYRCEAEIEQPLDRDTYAQMIIGIKNKIGGISPVDRAPREPYTLSTRAVHLVNPSRMRPNSAG